MTVSLAKSRSARGTEVGLKAVSTAQTCNLEKYTQPCLAACIRIPLLSYFCMHLELCHWNCTQNCIHRLRTECSCTCPMLQPLVWVMKLCFALSQVHLQYFFPNTTLSSRSGATKAGHVVRVREEFQYPFATSLWLIFTFWQAQRCKVKFTGAHQARHHPGKKPSSDNKSCEALLMLTF